MLKADHRRLARLLEDLARATARSGRRRDLLARTARQIRAHATIEEELFYPSYGHAARTKQQTRLLLESREMHALVSEVLDKLMGLTLTDESFAAKAKLLRDLVGRHAEEEEGDLFPAARTVLTPEELDALGVRMNALRRSMTDAA